MHYKDWSTLKAAGKVSFKEIAAVEAVEEVRDADDNITTERVESQNAYTVLEKKSYNPDTGAESTDEKRLSQSDLENEKSQLTSELARVQAELTEVGKMITEIQKV